MLLIIYLPFSKLSFIFDKLNINTSKVPLSFYKDKSFYTMRTDSADRFGTILEKRFSKLQIKRNDGKENLQNIKFSIKNHFGVLSDIKNKDANYLFSDTLKNYSSFFF